MSYFSFFIHLVPIWGDMEIALLIHSMAMWIGHVDQTFHSATLHISVSFFALIKLTLWFPMFYPYTRIHVYIHTFVFSQEKLFNIEAMLHLTYKNSCMEFLYLSSGDLVWIIQERWLLSVSGWIQDWSGKKRSFRAVSEGLRGMFTSCFITLLYRHSMNRCLYLC